MTTYDHRPGEGLETAGPDGHGGTTDQAKAAASTAGEEGKHLAHEAGAEMKGVAADAQDQARDLLHQARTEVESQSRTQLETLVSTLQGFADDLEKMARGEGPGSGLARDVVREVGDKATALSTQLRGREPAELLDEARTFARRKPGTFLLGALAAGVVAGRVVRGTKEAQSSQSTGSTGTSPDATSTAAMPLTQGTPPPPPPSPMPGRVPGSVPGSVTGSAPQAGTGTSASGWGTP
ncbi:MAG TPA: hypothetical protein VNT31_02870 [Nocardioides sp.]|nr:hypothetical protein [Nocardioides sp.]